MTTGSSISSQDLEQFFRDCYPLIPIPSLTAKTAIMTAPLPIDELGRFFADLDFRLEIERKTKLQSDLQLASEFSVFQFIEADENKLSDILAMLLDPQGTHGQQNLFLKSFVAKLKLNSEPSLQDAKVVREAITDTLSRNRRIDILVKTKGFVLAIENKVDSGEQQDQLKDYHEHLKNLPQKNYCLVFLTPEKRESISIPDQTATTLRSERMLIQWTYKEIIEWLEECRRWCEAEKTRHFLADFMQYIKTHLLRDQPEAE
jgi:hypothetical protein